MGFMIFKIKRTKKYNMNRKTAIIENFNSKKVKVHFIVVIVIFKHTVHRTCNCNACHFRNQPNKS